MSAFAIWIVREQNGQWDLNLWAVAAVVALLGIAWELFK